MSERHIKLILEAIKADEVNLEGYEKEVSMASFRADVACREAHPYELLLALWKCVTWDKYSGAGRCSICRSELPHWRGAECPIRRVEELTSTHTTKTEDRKQL